MHLVPISPDAIDWNDKTFEIQRFQEPAQLRASLGRFGILDPPWIREGEPGAKPVLVDGFRRLLWAQQNGVEEIHCLPVSPSLSLTEIWERRIEKRLLEGPVNLAEKARIANVLLGLFPGGKPPGFFLPELEISPRQGNLRKWAVLAQDGPAMLEMLASGEIAGRAALAAADWDIQSRMSALSVLKALRCSASIQVEIIERVGEIAVLEEKSPEAVLNDPRVQGILAAANANHRQKTQALRDLLSQIRFPRLARRQERFLKDLGELALPAGARLVPPPAFEGERWRLELYVSGPDELRNAIARTGEIAASERLERVFEPEREEA